MLYHETDKIKYKEPYVKLHLCGPQLFSLSFI
jgi:hypothetical protein